MAIRRSPKRKPKAWHSKLFRAETLSRGPARAMAIILFVVVTAWLVNTYAASAYAKYLASTTQCPNQKLVDSNRKPDMEAAMRCMVNYARRVHGDPALNDSALLDNAAADKNRDIVFCNSFSHTACGKAWTFWFYRDGYLPGNGGSWLVGENIAWHTGSGGSARSIMNAWLNSTEHRSNIFQSKYNGQGMSVRHSAKLFGYSDVWTWVNEFGCRNGVGC